MDVKKEIVSVRIPEDINRRFAAHVKKLGLTKNSFILTLISKELSKSKLT